MSSFSAFALPIWNTLQGQMGIHSELRQSLYFRARSLVSTQFLIDERCECVEEQSDEGWLPDVVGVLWHVIYTLMLRRWILSLIVTYLDGLSRFIAAYREPF